MGIEFCIGSNFSVVVGIFFYKLNFFLLIIRIIGFSVWLNFLGWCDFNNFVVFFGFFDCCGVMKDLNVFIFRVGKVIFDVISDLVLLFSCWNCW